MIIYPVLILRAQIFLSSIPVIESPASSNSVTWTLASSAPSVTSSGATKTIVVQSANSAVPQSSATLLAQQIYPKHSSSSSQPSAVIVPTSSPATEGSNNQESSIFIEAMEAILNSQMWFPYIYILIDLLIFFFFDCLFLKLFFSFNLSLVNCGNLRKRLCD